MAFEVANQSIKESFATTNGNTPRIGANYSYCGILQMSNEYKVKAEKVTSKKFKSYEPIFYHLGMYRKFYHNRT